MDHLKQVYHFFLFLPFTAFKGWSTYSFARKAVFFFVLFWFINFWNLTFKNFFYFLGVFPYPELTTAEFFIRHGSWVLCGILALYFGLKSKKLEKNPDSDAEIRWQKWGLSTGILMTGTTFLVFVFWLSS